MSEEKIVSIDEKLEGLGVPADVIEKIKMELGAATVEDLSGLTEQDLVGVGMKKLLETMEMPLVPLLAQLELNGVNIDTRKMESISRHVENAIEKQGIDFYREEQTCNDWVLPLFEILGWSNKNSYDEIDCQSKTGRKRNRRKV